MEEATAIISTAIPRSLARLFDETSAQAELSQTLSALSATNEPKPGSCVELLYQLSQTLEAESAKLAASLASALDMLQKGERSPSPAGTPGSSNNNNASSPSRSGSVQDEALAGVCMYVNSYLQHVDATQKAFASMQLASQLTEATAALPPHLSGVLAQGMNGHSSGETRTRPSGVSFANKAPAVDLTKMLQTAPPMGEVLAATIERRPTGLRKGLPPPPPQRSATMGRIKTASISAPASPEFMMSTSQPHVSIHARPSSSQSMRIASSIERSGSGSFIGRKMSTPGTVEPRVGRSTTLPPRSEGPPVISLQAKPPQNTNTVQIFLRDQLIAERYYVKLWSHAITLWDRVRAMKEKDRLSDKDAHTIFFKMDHLHSLHKDLAANMEEALKRWPNMLVGAMFLRKCFIIRRTYVEYLINFPIARDQLETAKATSKSFYGLLKSWEREAETTLENLMEMPDTRMRTYETFLANLLSNFDDRDPDYTNLIKAQREYQQIRIEMNRTIKTHTRTGQQIALRKQMLGGEDEFMVDHKRQLIKEGPMKQIVTEKQKAQEGDYFLITSDAIVSTRKVGVFQYKFMQMIPLKNAIIEKFVPLPKGVGSYPHTFRILTDRTTSFTFQCQTEGETKEWRTAVKKALELARANQLFGIPLKVIMETEQTKSGNNVPWLVEETVDYITNHCLKKEGIFRLAGSAVEIEALRDMIQTGKRFKFEEMNGVYDDNVISDIFKQWIRELPEPILTWGLFPEWIQTFDIANDQARMERLKELVESLPTTNQYILQLLMKCLRSVVDLSDINKMTSSNVAIVFGPNIIKRKRGPLIDPDAHKLYKVCQDLITFYEPIFLEIERQRIVAKEAGERKLQEAEKVEHQRIEFLSTVPITRSALVEESPTVAIPDSDIIKSGTLLKKPKGRGSGANKIVWCVLKYKRLSFYKNKNDKSPSGEVSLNECCVDLFDAPQVKIKDKEKTGSLRGDDSGGKDYGFVILGDDINFFFFCASEKERNDWVAAINSCIESRVNRRL
eukprot:TRINITY_DN1674_c0_g1_i1.p1 TRINITY_DN1674_c0_g1~~TRINITY_DN1674_c0_g1_i1.p1  ORF type:complete len:1017 (-),score=160.00 TRINITY_DN1674_c0_g1_i1:152-3202(-)